MHRRLSCYQCSCRACRNSSGRLCPPQHSGRIVGAVHQQPILPSESVVLGTGRGRTRSAQ